MAGIHINSKISSLWTRKWPISLGFWFSFFAFPFLIFLLQWLTFYCACFQFKNFWKSIITTGNFYHGLAKCSHRKLYFEFSEHCRAYFRLYWANHTDLGITGKIFFNLQILSLDHGNFGQRPTLITAIYSWHRHQWVNMFGHNLLVLISSTGNFLFWLSCF